MPEEESVAIRAQNSLFTEKTDAFSPQIVMVMIHVRLKTDEEVKQMAVHHGGKVGKAGKTLASKGSSKSAKSKAGKTLASHKAKAH